MAQSINLEDAKLKVAAAKDTLNWCRHLSDEDLAYVFEDTRVDPKVFGQLLMQHLPEDGATSDDRRFWLNVANHIGPDYVSTFDRVANFMVNITDGSF